MGGLPLRCDVELHTTRLDRVLEHSQADMVVSVEAGITLEALQDELGKAGQVLPLDPFNSPGHTIGGLLATGWTGPLRLRFGSARDFLIGIRVALPDGHLASAGGRVVKNVSGYDLMKLHFGAMGSLGVIVAASFKLFPRPLHDVTVEASASSTEDAWAHVTRALELPLPPSALELFSDGRLMARFFGSPDAVNRMVAELGWKEADASLWAEHSRRGPESWARIAVPRPALQGAESRSFASPWMPWGLRACSHAKTAARSSSDARSESGVFSPPSIGEISGSHWKSAPSEIASASVSASRRALTLMTGVFAFTRTPRAVRRRIAAQVRANEPSSWVTVSNVTASGP